MDKQDEIIEKIYKVTENLEKRMQRLEDGIKRSGIPYPEKAGILEAMIGVFSVLYRKKTYLAFAILLMSLIGVGYFVLFSLTGLKPELGLSASGYRLLISGVFALLIGLPLYLMLHDFRQRQVMTKGLAAGGALSSGFAGVASIGSATAGTAGSTIIASCAPVFSASAASLSGSAVAASTASAGGAAAVLPGFGVIGPVISPALIAIAVIVSFISFNNSVKNFYKRHRR